MILLIDENSSVSTELQEGRAAMGGSRRDEVAQVAVMARKRGPMEHVQNINFVLLAHHRRAARTVDVNLALKIAEQMSRSKGNSVTDVSVSIASTPGSRTVQTHSGIVKDLGPIVEQGAA